jgi:pimeloyl-ACP methyl ester carboxylesterase
MATFVLVHGGWGGGWEWTPIANALRKRGHEAFTPTLTGLGEREHIRASEVTLSDHVADVEAVLDFEGLDDVLLCGHSYSGMVVSGVADRMAERVGCLVHLDSFAPRDGESLQDLAPPGFVESLVEVGRERGDDRAPIPTELLPSADDGDDAVRRYVQRLRPQSTKTMTERLRLTGAIDGLPRAYVRCTGYEGSIMDAFAERAQREGWWYREIDTQHDLHVHAPADTVDVLVELASESASR